MHNYANFGSLKLHDHTKKKKKLNHTLSLPFLRINIKT